jgi:O-antigen ligase
VAVLLRLYAIRDRTTITSQPTRAWLWVAAGAFILIAIGALQLVPLPPPILRTISRESFEIWSAAANVASMAGVKAGSSHPISIDPPATTFEVLRIIALFAAFTAIALLVRSHQRRVALASVLCAAAVFEAMYGLREAALQRYEIWGWVNRLIFHRVTGTFVNPNHFAHYMAIVLPMALFLAAIAWHRAGSPQTPLSRRLLHLIEHSFLRTAVSVIVLLVSLLAILLAQSRGTLLATGVGILAVGAFLPGRRVLRFVLGATAGLVIVATLALFLGPERSVRRFQPAEIAQGALEGRRIGISAAIGVWQRFPVLGSGLGTFHRAVYLEQSADLTKTYHHAHNDYAEIAATAGAIGFLGAVGSLFAGYAALIRMTFGAAAADLSWSRRAYQVAALTSLTIAMIHALVDFNFFIPSNPATLAAIAGAAVAVTDRDKRTRR